VATWHDDVNWLGDSRLHPFFLLDVIYSTWRLELQVRAPEASHLSTNGPKRLRHLAHGRSRALSTHCEVCVTIEACTSTHRNAKVSQAVMKTAILNNTTLQFAARAPLYRPIQKCHAFCVHCSARLCAHTARKSSRAGLSAATSTSIFLIRSFVKDVAGRAAAFGASGVAFEHKGAVACSAPTHTQRGSLQYIRAYSLTILSHALIINAEQ